MILTCQSISKAFIEKEILNNISFFIEENEKVAIVGMNGSGKTTLLRIIVGELEADSGNVILSKDKSIGYLSQKLNFTSDSTIYDELLSVKQNLVTLEHNIRSLETKMHSVDGIELEEIMEQYAKATHEFEQNGGYIYQSELIGVLKGLGFLETEFSKKMTTLSGGQKTRVALGKLLLLNPELIILDEPTNHLDLNSIAWLETYLQNYKGAVILVSHDRYFLDKITQKVIEIERHQSTTFIGNYSDYIIKKEHLKLSQQNAYINQQKEIKHQEEVIKKLRSFNREKSIKRAESRMKLLDKVERLEKPREENYEMNLRLTPAILSGKDVLCVKELSKSFDSNILFQTISFDLKRGTHTAIIGNNGTGKTTLLKIINGLLDADDGSFTLGSNVHIGYYDQEHNVLHSDKTIFEEISDEYPFLSNTEIRNVLASFLFMGDDVFKRIKELSGGERGRVSLAKLMLSNANFLILDEPTNHLDIFSKEILEDAINSYEGTILYVSHDRYFINRTAECVLELEQHSIQSYLGNYDYYIEKKNELLPMTQITAANTTVSESKKDWKSQKEEQASLRKLENDLKKCEDQISDLEANLSQLNFEMTLPENATNVAALQMIAKEQANISAQLNLQYELWEQLSNMLT